MFRAPGWWWSIALCATLAAGEPNQLISRSAAGAPGNADSGPGGVDVSSDGRWVVFASDADNLVAGDTNGVSDVYARDRATGRVLRVSVPPGGGQFTTPAVEPSISGDGRFVAFIRDMVPSDGPPPYDEAYERELYIRDLVTGSTVRLDVPSGDGYSSGPFLSRPRLSRDGRVVVWSAFDAHFADDICIFDRGTGALTTVPHGVHPLYGADDDNGTMPIPSADGRFIAFAVSHDWGFGPHAALLYDRVTGGFEDLSRASDGQQPVVHDAAGSVWHASLAVTDLSGDARYVVFTTNADNLVADDHDAQTDVYVRDRLLGRLTRVSVASTAHPFPEDGDAPLGRISDDGRFVWFVRYGGKPSGFPNRLIGLYVRDRLRGETVPAIVRGSDRGDPEFDAFIRLNDLAITADGVFAAYDSDSPRVGASDGFATRDVFVSRSPLSHEVGVALLRVNFQPPGAPVPSGYVADLGQPFGLRPNGRVYGWNAPNTALLVDRDSPRSPDQRYDTLIGMQTAANPTARWEAAVPNGRYWVRVVCGDPQLTGAVYRVRAEGVNLAWGRQSLVDRWVEGSALVLVRDGRLTLTTGAGAIGTTLCFVDIVADPEQAPAFVARINFQPEASYVPPGDAIDVGHVFAPRGDSLSYGWNAPNEANTRERFSDADYRHDTFAFMQAPSNPDARWEIALPNGRYGVAIVAGDPAFIDGYFVIRAEGRTVLQGLQTATHPWVEANAEVEVRDGRLTLSNGPYATNNRLNYVEILAEPSGPG